jgi:hypothetical protein
MKRTFRIILLYLLAVGCLSLYFFLDNSKDLGGFLRRADEISAKSGFGLMIALGFIKLVSLVAGAAIPFFVTIEVIRGWLKKPEHGIISSNDSASHKPIASRKYSASQKRPRNSIDNNSTYE